MQLFKDHVWRYQQNWQAHTFRADGLLHLHVFPKQEAVDGAAHPKGIHTPAPCTSFLHLNAPKCLCLGITLQKVREESLVKLLCSACGEDQAEEQAGSKSKETIRREKASTQYIFACKGRWELLHAIISSAAYFGNNACSQLLVSGDLRKRYLSANLELGVWRQESCVNSSAIINEAQASLGPQARSAGMPGWQYWAGSLPE